MIIGAGCPVDRDGTALQQSGLVRFTGDQYNPMWSWVRKELEKLGTGHLRNLAGQVFEVETTLLDPQPVFELSDKHATMPYRSKLKSVGLDLFACRPMIIYGGETTIIPLGFRCEFNVGWGAFIWDRSGMGAKGFHRFAGVIESDYRGLWGVVLHNTTPRMFRVEPSKAVAQVVFQPVWMGEPKSRVVNRNTDRGDSGFGSTDK